MKKKLIVCLGMLISTIGILSGCGKKDTVLSSDELISKIKDQIKDVNSISYTADIDTKINEAPVSITIKGSTIKEDMTAKLDVTANLADSEFAASGYLINGEDGVTAYACIEDNWIYSPVPMEAIKNYIAEVDIFEYMNDKAVKEINGGYTLTSKIDVDKIAKRVNEEANATSINADCVITTDKSGNIKSISIKIAGPDVAETDENSINITNLDLYVSVDAINTIESIELPEAAKNAIDINEFLGALLSEGMDMSNILGMGSEEKEDNSKELDESDDDALSYQGISIDDVSEDEFEFTVEGHSVALTDSLNRDSLVYALLLDKTDIDEIYEYGDTCVSFKADEEGNVTYASLIGDKKMSCSGSSLGNVRIYEAISEVEEVYGTPDYNDTSNGITTYIYYNPNGVKELMVSFLDGYVSKITVQIK